MTVQHNRVVQLGQSSLQAGHDPADVYRDALASLSHADDARGFTEAARYHEALREACRAQGYTLCVASAGDTAIAVRHTVVAQEFRPVLPASHKPLHGPRGVQAVTFQLGDELVTVCELHIVRKAVSGKQQLAMVDELGQIVAASAQGRRLGFYMGDMNHDDRRRPYSRFDAAERRADLTSCWDELGRWPPTHEPQGTTLDVVGSYDPDRRVRCLRARTWHQLHSDHHSLSAYYGIAPARP